MTEVTNLYTRLSTGNELLSLPEISTATAGVLSAGFIYSSFRACIELHGSAEHPFLRPTVEVEGRELFEGGINSELLSYWVPRFEVTRSGIRASSTVFAPLDRRGFVCVLEFENVSENDLEVKAGWRTCWESTFHAAKLPKLMAGAKHARISKWRQGVPVVEYRGHTPLFAVAMVTGELVPVDLRSAITPEAPAWSDEEVRAPAGRPLFCDAVGCWTLKPGEKRVFPLYMGIGMEEVSAIASAQELKLHGWERMLAGLTSWLDARTIDCEDDDIKRIINMNSFYNYFYCQAIALDTEELVVMSARSARSDRCASYNDRDALMWSLPAVLQVNWSQARALLLHGLTAQLPNLGIRSRCISGIVLEPGLQLDQLCAPLQALHAYVQLTGDMSVLFDRRVQNGINSLQQTLAAQRHQDVELFETLLLPSGEPSTLPYVCYSNVIVWRALRDACWMYDLIRDLDRSLEARSLADKIRSAVMANLVVEGPFGRQFARAVDLEGNFELGDDPGGSLQMLPYLGFCSHEDRVYRNTIKWINSEHNPRFEEWAWNRSEHGNRSVLAAINDLLAGRKEAALDFIKSSNMDSGIACETVDGRTGEAIDGKGYASAAGYLAHGLRIALNLELPEKAAVTQQRRPGEVLYQPPPPEASPRPKKARL